MRRKEEIEERFLEDINLLFDKPELGEDSDLRSDALKRAELLFWILEGGEEMTTFTDKPVECPRGHRLGLEDWGKECPQCKKEDKMKEKRMGRGEYYLAVLEAVKQRSTCDRGKSGAILVKRGRIFATGYVGSPAGTKHCDEIGHLIELRHIKLPNAFAPPSTHCIRTVHAELNAILQAADFGVSVRGATMYCTMMPCFECAKAIVNVGIKKVIAVHPYQAQQRTIFLFREVELPFTILNPDKELY